jgi:threonylcarbamoyladenosine tRNA methylthiotransferase MtaB
VRSKPLAALKAELEGLAAAGYQEAVLVGINLSSYGLDLGLRLRDAVELACAQPGIGRIRLGSLEPELLSGGDIAAMSRLEKLCPQFHLSLQSGCDATLRRMRRPYSTGDYRKIAAALRAAFPNAAITTDIMVGFPGETGEEFEESLAFVRETGFARAHVFAYSRRGGTPAAAMPGQISNQEKLARSRAMLAAAAESSRAFLEARLGAAASVLFETRRPDGRWEGYSENYIPVLAASPACLSGKIRPVTLVSVEGEACVGEIVGRESEAYG